MSELVERLTAALTGRYTVERELGRGGMALVFLAQDLKHHRPVAIKVLRPELAAALGAGRFLREIETAARLTHPHILPLHDSGEAEGFLYYVMPYVEGESLRDRLNREKQLPLDDALQIAREAADALSYAHSHDVIHRDIKPENILFEAGHAVVTDFGIARAITAAGGEKLTETGIAVGTPAYMSPEQAAGSRELDGRSDLYALGCVLYEMLAGQPPFVGPTVESVVHQHLATEAPSITGLRPAVPGWVAAALARSLAKTPADRFNPVALFAEALRPAAPAAWAPSGPAPSRWWRRAALVGGGIALLVGGGWLGSRLVHQRPRAGFAAHRPYTIVAEIDGTAPQDVRIAARNVVMEALDQSGVIATLPDDQLRLGLHLAGRPDSARLDLATARELAVRGAIRTVVAGTIDRVGETYHVGVRILDADSGVVVAARREVARGDDDLIPTVDRVMRALRTDFGERSDAIAANRPLEQAATPSFEAYKRYVRARQLVSNGDYAAAVAAYRDAIALDPDFAAAWRGLGADYSNIGKPDSALLAVNEALARPGRLTEAQRLDAEGLRALFLGDDEAAADAYGRAYREYGAPPYMLGYVLDNLGRDAEAVALSEEWGRSTPFGLRPQQRFDAAVWLTTLGRYDEARHWAATLTGGLHLRALLFLADHTGDWTAAESLGAEVLKLARGNERWRAEGLTGRASARAARGRVGEAVAQLRGSTQPLPRWAIVILRVASGSRIARSEIQTIRTDTTAGGRLFTALWAAGAGDTVFARRSLAEVRSLPVDRRRGLDGEAVLVEAWLAAAAGRTSEVIRLLQPLGERGTFRFPPINQLTRWTLADAYERVGQLDSAAVQVARVAAWEGFWSHELLLRGLTHSFAHRRLVLLYAKMGRVEDARRHWKIFSATFTNPDPELVPLVEEARDALRRAERAGG